MDLQDSVQRSLQNPAEKSCRSAQIRKDREPGLCHDYTLTIVVQVDASVFGLERVACFLSQVFRSNTSSFQKQEHRGCWEIPPPCVVSTNKSYSL